MPALKQSGKTTTSKTVKSSAASAFAQVQKGKTSAVTKEAVKSNADRHREAMIRLANR